MVYPRGESRIEFKRIPRVTTPVAQKMPVLKDVAYSNAGNTTDGMFLLIAAAVTCSVGDNEVYRRDKNRVCNSNKQTAPRFPRTCTGMREGKYLCQMAFIRWHS